MCSAPEIVPGFAFILASRSVDGHMWVILSDPTKYPAALVAVSLTTWTPRKDDSCILDIGDHPFVNRKTCVAYQYADITTTHALTRGLRVGAIQELPPVRPEIVRRIVAGALATAQMTREARAVLERQLTEQGSRFR